MTKRIFDPPFVGDAPLDQALHQVIEGTLEQPVARRIVRWAGRSGDPRLLPLLREIAERTSEERYLRLTFESLCSAQLLGEPTELFVDHARKHQTNKWLAYPSILILGRDPADERAAAVLTEIKAETRDNQILGAIAEAERVRAVAAEYSEVGTFEERVNFILRHCRGEWSPVASPPPELGWALHPLTEWARRKLSDLSHENPEAVARVIAQMDLSADYPSEEPVAAYRIYLSSFISDEARQKLTEMI